MGRSYSASGASDENSSSVDARADSSSAAKVFDIRASEHVFQTSMESRTRLLNRDGRRIRSEAANGQRDGNGVADRRSSGNLEIHLVQADKAGSEAGKDDQ